MIFNHISPDPKSTDDQIPITPYWHVEDIWLGARYILRRRNGEEVRERAKIIRSKLFSYEDDLLNQAIMYGGTIPFRPFDAYLLKEIILPNRALPFRPPAKGEKIKLPLTIEPGWLEAEDFAILTLLKVDEAIDAIQDGTPEDLVVVAGVLLDAYQCLLQAERAKGQYVLTPDEFVTFRDKCLKAKKERISEQNSTAAKQHQSESVKEEVLELFRQMQEERPEVDSRVIAKEIADMYMKTVYPDDAKKLSCNECLRFKELNWKLLPTRARRTIIDWIMVYDLKQAPTKSPQNTLQDLRNKHQF